ncbi:MAG: hypothetical protein HC821_02195, partial [Lewinella sp.]|nr:hypothetical protein [Lewinella sp.]
MMALQGNAMALKAQAVTPQQQEQARNEIKRRGLDEQEVKSKLQLAGLDVERMSASELALAQPQIEAVLEALEAEQRMLASQVDSLVPSSSPVPSPPQPRASPRPIAEEPKERPASALSDIYGHAIFQNRSLEVYQNTDNAQAPDSYRLGSGDAVAVSIFGASQADLKFIIDQEGFILPPSMPRIYLKGIPLGQARQLVE